MSTNFLKDFESFTDDPDVLKDAAERVTGRHYTNKKVALGDLQIRMRSEQAFDAAEAMFDTDAISRDTLRRWVQTLELPVSGTKADLTDRLLAYYFGEDEDEDDDLMLDGDFALLMTVDEACTAADLKTIAAAIGDTTPRTRADAYDLLYDALASDADADTREAILLACAPHVFRTVCELWEVAPTPRAQAIDTLIAQFAELDDDSDDQDDDADATNEPAPPPVTRDELLAMLVADPASASPLYPHQQQAVDAAWSARTGDTPRFQVSVPTGGGKTRIGTEIANREVQAGGRVLWVTMNWHLLWQGALDAARRHDLFRKGLLGRFGGVNKEIGVLPEGVGRLRFTSLHTLRHRLDSVLDSFQPTLVVWDECHWGQGGVLGTPLKRKLARRGTPVLGLSATPKGEDGMGFQKVYDVSFKELVAAGRLAAPKLIPPVQLDTRIKPTLNKFHDFDDATIEALATDSGRNASIVRHWAENRGTYGKTIMFACDIDHANELVRRLKAAGARAEAIHSRALDIENTAALDRFKRGETDVVIGVAMLTHGIDVPAIQTVVLTRPTTSDILYAQMIGRGARLAPGKTAFNIVEFTDASFRHLTSLLDGHRHFAGAGGVPTTPPDRSSVRGLVGAAVPVTAPTIVTNPLPSGQQASLDAIVRPTVASSGATCRACTAPLAPGFAFCPECGIPVAPPACSCGRSWAEGAKFCTGCGARRA
jgi:superfamily II DNA or RNA helicase